MTKLAMNPPCSLKDEAPAVDDALAEDPDVALAEEESESLEEELSAEVVRVLVADAVELAEGVMGVVTAVKVPLEGIEVVLKTTGMTVAVFEPDETSVPVRVTATVSADEETDPVDVAEAVADAEALLELESCSQIPLETCWVSESHVSIHHEADTSGDVLKASEIEHELVTQLVIFSVNSSCFSHKQAWSVTPQPTSGAPVSKQLVYNQSVTLKFTLGMDVPSKREGRLMCMRRGWGPQGQRTWRWRASWLDVKEDDDDRRSQN